MNSSELSVSERIAAAKKKLMNRLSQGGELNLNTPEQNVEGHSTNLPIISGGAISQLRRDAANFNRDDFSASSYDPDSDIGDEAVRDLAGQAFSGAQHAGVKLPEVSETSQWYDLAVIGGIIRILDKINAARNVEGLELNGTKQGLLSDDDVDSVGDDEVPYGPF